VGWRADRQVATPGIIYGEGDLCGKTDTAQTPIADQRLIITLVHVERTLSAVAVTTPRNTMSIAVNPDVAKFELEA